VFSFFCDGLFGGLAFGAFGRLDGVAGFGVFGGLLLNLPLLLIGKLLFDVKRDGLVLAFEEAGTRPGLFGTPDSFDTENDAPRALALGPSGFNAFGVFGVFDTFDVLDGFCTFGAFGATFEEPDDCNPCGRDTDDDPPPSMRDVLRFL